MKKLCVLMAALAVLAFAASPTLYQGNDNGSGVMRIKPQAVPTSSTIVTAVDAYVRQVTITNTTAGALTFTLSDRQSSAIDFLSAVSIAANTTYVVALPAPYWCPGGFTVVASGSGLTYSAAWGQ